MSVSLGPLNAPLTADAAVVSLTRMARQYHQAGQLREAMVHYKQILAIDPRRADILMLIGVVAWQMRDYERAERLYRAALILEPRNADILNNLALAEKSMGRHEEAERTFRQAISVEPYKPDAYANLGEMLTDSRPTEAVNLLWEAAFRQPEKVGIWVALGSALRRDGRPEESAAALYKALELDENQFEAQVNLGNALKDCGDYPAAEAAYEAARKIRPGTPALVEAEAVLQLLQGRFAEGWANYAARQYRPEFKLRLFPQAEWDGSPLPKGKLLVWGEQGIGDEILYAGMIADLMARNQRLVVECAPRLTPLFARSFPNVEVVPRTEPHHPATRQGSILAQISMGGLGKYLRPDWISFPLRPAYLAADAARAERLRKKYLSGQASGTKLIGISWRSSAPNGAIKSPRLEDWAALFQIKDAVFVSLQYGEQAADLAAFAEQFGVAVVHDAEIDPLQDIDAQAAQIAALDHVVTISNTTAHLAGGLGKKGHVLLPKFQGLHWYWFQDHEISLWYPSLRLMRQPGPGDWPSAVARIAAEIKETKK